MDIRQIINKKIEDSDIENLRLWNIETSIEGILMPNYDTFVDKVLLMNFLWEQVSDNKINYLFGMGIAIELALQGNVINRAKKNKCYPYRSHNEIYLYNVDKQHNNFYNNTITFFKVFNNVNIYPKTSTTMLHNLDNNLLDNNYDTVLIHNHKLLIPKLEILFLDSYLSREMSKREEGHDYELLIKEYDLDLDLILRYLEEYYINYNISIGNSKYDNLVDEQIKAIERILDTGKKVDRSLFNLEEQISSYPKGNNFKYAGIYVDLWIPLSVDSVVYNKGSYKIEDENYINKLKDRVYLYRENDLQRYEEITENIKDLFMRK